MERIIQALLEKISDEESVVNKQINTYGGPGFVEVEVIMEVLESIGKKQKI